MDADTVARWQFGITTVYHFFFVPITIALSMLVAVMQTIWYRSGNEQFLRLTKFFGKLFLINFALGVVTGIVQEFQFGMNWSEFSRAVGDVFGAPLALEALLAFFLESTFLGLWIFGWDRLPKRLHLLSIYAAALGTMISAVFILAANSWMQHPVGTVFRNGRAELDGVAGFGELLTNEVFLTTFLHTISGAYMVAGGLVAGISGWHLAKLNKRITNGEDNPKLSTDAKAHRWATRFGAVVLLGASVLVMFSGDLQAKAMTQVQPVKMAAAEAVYYTNPEGTSASFSLITIGTLDGMGEPLLDIRIPGLLSLISGEERVQGLHDLKAQYEQDGFLKNDGSVTALQEGIKAAIAEGKASPQLAESFKVLDIIPNVPVTYWTFRAMIGLGLGGMIVAAWILFATRKNRAPKDTKLWGLAMITLPFMPLFANSVGWIFAEMGRQPWLVAGFMPTAMGVSPTVTVAEVWISLIVYTLIYGALAVIEVHLFLKYAKAGLPDVTPVELRKDDEPLSFAY